MFLAALEGQRRPGVFKTVEVEATGSSMVNEHFESTDFASLSLPKSPLEHIMHESSFLCSPWSFCKSAELCRSTSIASQYHLIHNYSDYFPQKLECSNILPLC